jgi:hypothetical protein
LTRRTTSHHRRHDGARRVITARPAPSPFPSLPPADAAATAYEGVEYRIELIAIDTTERKSNKLLYLVMSVDFVGV